MKNPFKFGTIVEGEYFTDRDDELQQIKQLLNSDNHLILISPRRFGKSSLVKKAVTQVARPCISLNLQMVVSVEGLAAMILKEVFKLHPWEKLKHLLSSFRVCANYIHHTYGRNHRHHFSSHNRCHGVDRRCTAIGGKSE